MAHEGSNHLKIPVQCTEAFPDVEDVRSKPVIPVSPRESKTSMNCKIRRLGEELNATKQLVIVEGKRRVEQVGQVAKQLASLESEMKKEAVKVSHQVDDLKQQMHSMKHDHDYIQHQLSLLQKTEKSTQLELTSLQSRVDGIPDDSKGVPSVKEMSLLLGEVPAPCDLMQNTDLVMHLTTITSEAKEVKASLEKHVEVLEMRLESVERNFMAEERIHQRLQQLQTESQRIEKDVNMIKEDLKKGLEDVKQQIEGLHVTPIARPEAEAIVRHRKQAVTNVMDLPEESLNDVLNASTIANDGHPASTFAKATTGRANRASRASSGYYSIPSISRSDSNTSLWSQRLSQFSLEEFEALKEEEYDADECIDTEVN